MTRILAINGSYRDDGITDQAVGIVVQAAEAVGAEMEVVRLHEYPIEFCLNCRECTQQPGTAPGSCVQHDGMADLVRKIEAADAFVLASPTNFGSTTALFKRFMERLIVYAYWPWVMHSPQLRKAGEPRKKAALITSCAAPAILGRWAYGTHKQLQMTAKTIGAEPVGTLSIGMIAKQPHPVLPPQAMKSAQALGRKLAGA
ncbi:Iron-sulfur flavoprotein [hydrothermal vent metagenome]|uniref:Iron-sulfur flavoprotein n=1 Tax=hydrothermal vent metagenome TaxID=652676 RepID=A0A3B1AKS2_9ZZZZ